MSIDITLIATVLGVMALAALAVSCSRPFRTDAEAETRTAALERLERELGQRAVWTNPHARPRGAGQPVGERRNGEYPRLRLVSNATGEHVGEASPAS